MSRVLTSQAVQEAFRRDGVRATIMSGTDEGWTDVCADSRKITKGAIFVALRGLSVDGRDFISQAIQSGAKAILGKDLPEIDMLEITRIETPDPHTAYIALLKAFYPKRPEYLMAVTGTNGKTSVSTFVQNILSHAGIKAASIGTLGVLTDEGVTKGTLTTPDPYALYTSIHALSEKGTKAIIMEASSHGLDQGRLEGLMFDVAAFTNLSRDHLDYHKTMDAYRAAKHLLFTDYLKPEGQAICYDDPQTQEADRLEALMAQKGKEVRRVGQITPENEQNADLFDIVLEGVEVDGLNQLMHLSGPWGGATVNCPLPGAFQAENILVALAIVSKAGVPIEVALQAIPRLRGVRGRMELVGQTATGAAVFVDFAHTPDGLETALTALRPHIEKNSKLCVICGAGGDRDRGKRPLMGKVAAQRADRVIITDDNPRSENPASIREQILEGIPASDLGKVSEIPNRAEAIRTTIFNLQKGDALIIAGKGHEEGQILKDKTIHFSDQTEAEKAMKQTYNNRAI